MGLPQVSSKTPERDYCQQTVLPNWGMVVKCSVCQGKECPVYLRHQHCTHFVCSQCVRDSVSLTGVNPASYPCSLCEPEVDYQKECPACYVVYSEQCPRATHDCLDDEAIFEC